MRTNKESPREDEGSGGVLGPVELAVTCGTVHVVTVDVVYVPVFPVLRVQVVFRHTDLGG